MLVLSGDKFQEVAGGEGADFFGRAVVQHGNLNGGMDNIRWLIAFAALGNGRGTP